MSGGSKWRPEGRALDAVARREAPGEFVELSRGYTHFELGGPPTARTVVLIHGFSVPYFIWDPTFRFLTEAGRRVLRYDLFGRGYSDRPDVAYDMALFIQQLEQLLDALGIQQADVIGLSMGGPIAAAFSVADPRRVGRLVLVGPSGARAIHLGFLYRIAVLPGISDALFRIAGNDYMLRAVAEDFFDPELVRLFRERYRAQMEYRGFRRAILSSVRSGMLGSFAGTYRILDTLKKRILVIWGEHDKTVPYADSHRMRQLLSTAEFVPVRNSGHIPHYERPDFVNPLLIRFLN
ncbi:MAG TPA: alpha/beta hydrolase [Anaerolineales bacterium]|nr:alpha/beta hydrolase [Anaerolineales bacterium]